MTHGSLFSGIGGFELGAQMVGIETLWSCEIEEFQRKILKQNFPKTAIYEDIRDVKNPGYVDIFSGGFPCQDISVAGKGVGIKGERSGLWSEMFRIIRAVRPKYAIIKNSPALLIRGFERILLDLSEIGYNAEWQCISNLTFGYPHKRERVYLIAYSTENRLQGDIFKYGCFDSIFKKWTPNKANGYSLSQRILEMPTCESIRNEHGFQNWAHRVGSLGNAVNPTVAKYLFECIKLFEDENNNR